MTLPQVQAILEAKAHYIGAAAGSILGTISSLTGITNGNNSLIVVILCSVGGGFVANLPRLLSVVYKKRADDQEYVAKHYRSIIEDYVRNARTNEQAVQLHIDCRHDLQGALQAAYFRLDYINETYNVSQEHRMPRYDVETRMKQLDKDILALKQR